MDTVLNDINKLHDRIHRAEMHLITLQKKLKKKQQELQLCCDHKEYFSSDNGDYHKPGLIYRCICCNYITYNQPQDKIIHRR